MKRIKNLGLKHIILIIISALLAILLVSAFFLGDPGEHVVSVSVLNDLNAPVTLKQCIDDSCKRIANTYTLDPGKSLTAGGTNNDTKQPWTVINSEGRKIGCMDLNFPGEKQGIAERVFLSKLQPCK